MEKKQEPSSVPFGFENIPEGEKTERVRSLFDRVAGRYDLMNDVMSLGVHRYWKRCMVKALNPQPAMKIIDVAGGTGDIAFRILEECPSAEVTVCDMTAGMLAEGQNRAWNRGIIKNLDWTCGNAESLPFPDQTFDAYTIAFGLRNVTRPDQALREAYRVLKPGGRLLCLEFSQVQLPPLNSLYKAYSFRLIPCFGRLIGKDEAAYKYLVESIDRFFDQETLKRMMDEAGFEGVSYENYMGGVAALHEARRSSTCHSGQRSGVQ